MKLKKTSPTQVDEVVEEVVEELEEENEVVYEINDKLATKKEEVKEAKEEVKEEDSPLEALKLFVNSLTEEKFERIGEEFAKKWSEDNSKYIEAVDKFVNARLEKMTGEKDLDKLGNLLGKLL